MTILHLISSEGYYGAEAMLVALARNSRKFRCRAVVGVFQDSRAAHLEIAGEAAKCGLPVEIVPCNGRLDLRAVGRIRDLVDKRRVDVLHTHGYKADIYAYLAGRRCETALVATCHNWPGTLPTMRAYASLDRLVLRGFDKVVPVSESVAAILRSAGIAGRRLTVIPNGIDPDPFAAASPSLSANEHEPHTQLVGFAGRLVDCKGGPVLLRAARSVLAAFPDVMFVFAGDGPLRSDWERLAASLGIADRVIFLGRRDDMPGIYASLDILVLPSLTEAAPMCLLEGMAAGKPVVATRVGGVPDMVAAGVSGLLVDVGDAEGLAESLLLLLRNPEFSARLGRNGQLRVAKHFSAERMAATYMDVYREVAAMRSGEREAALPAVGQS